MGQITSFFGVSHSVLQRLIADPAAFDYATDPIAREGCNQTHEGLRYVLSKGRKPEIVELVNQIFYPISFLGNEPDYANLDFDNLPDDIDLGGNAIYYNGPAEVKSMSAFLATVTAEEFAALFDPDELNQAGIYPGAWNKETDEKYAFNERATIQDFLDLKQFFERIARENAYCLVFTG